MDTTETTESPLVKFRGLQRLLKEYHDYLYNIHSCYLFSELNDTDISLEDESKLIEGFLVDNQDEIDMFLRAVSIGW